MTDQNDVMIIFYGPVHGVSEESQPVYGNNDEGVKRKVFDTVPSRF